MNQRTAGLAAVCFGVAVVVRLMVAAPVGYWLPVLAEGVGAWLIYSALIAGFEAKAAVVLLAAGQMQPGRARSKAATLSG